MQWAFKFWGVAVTPDKIQRQYLLILRFLAILENHDPENLRKKNWFASKFYFQKLPGDVNWLRSHLKVLKWHKPLSDVILRDTN